MDPNPGRRKLFFFDTRGTLSYTSAMQKHCRNCKGGVPQGKSIKFLNARSVGDRHHHSGIAFLGQAGVGGTFEVLREE